MAKIILFLTIFGIIFSFCNSLSFSNGRIVGGDVASTPTQFPYQISLRKNGKHDCGGAIISDSWILTAFHCVLTEPKRLTVVAGTIFLDGGGQERKVKRVITHEKAGRGHYDIALIELDEPFKLSQSIKAIKLVHTDIPTDGKVVISGWGRIGDTEPPSNILKFNVNLSKLDQEICKFAVRSPIYDLYYDGLICLKHSVGNGACSGDSGGPATYDGELVGLASFIREGCGTANPDGYTKVSYFVHWINEKTGLKLQP